MGGKFDRLEKSLPYYFSIVFDVKNGSGVYACNKVTCIGVGKDVSKRTVDVNVLIHAHQPLFSLVILKLIDFFLSLEKKDKKYTHE